ncbi:MAG: hypothetical protein ACI9VS_002086 [Candidatus Binatia bacterium]|jgi:hypothetical protein
MRAHFVGIGRSLFLFCMRAHDMRTQRANALLLPRMRAGKVTARDMAAFGVAARRMTAVQMGTQRANAPFLFRVSARVMTAGKMRSRREGAGGV